MKGLIKMTVEEIKSQLRELIDDRKSLKSGKYCDAVDNEIYDNDIAALTAAINIIENDTVKHGAAIPPPPESKALPTCSICGEEVFGSYCSNCGARMDGETNA